jgi:DNA/RNA endonuclease YhcR with UshA esterase domain
LRVRQQVRVIGVLADSSGQLILVPTDARSVHARGRGTNIRAESVPTGRVNETTEGRLVQVTGTITKPIGNDLPYGYRVFINDGSGEIQAFVYVSTGIDVSGLRPGQRVGVTGFSGQYNDHYEIIPRFQTDIRRSR